MMTHIIDTELVQSFGNLNLLGGIEEGGCELFALTECALNDLEVRNIAQEIANSSVRIVSVGVLSRRNSSETWVACTTI
jgi:hypothetical protein